MSEVTLSEKLQVKDPLSFTEPRQVSNKIRKLLSDLDKETENHTDPSVWNFSPGLRRLFSDIPSTVFNRSGYAVVLHTPQAKLIFHTPEDLPVLTITNTRLFATKCTELLVELKKTDPWHRYFLYSWTSRQDHKSVFSQATFSDFQNPIQFLTKQTNILRDTRFDHLQEQWVPLTNLPDTSLLHYGQFTASPDMEAMHELRYRLGNTETQMLPVIRFGITDEREATIFAVQMPPIQNYTERVVDYKLANDPQERDMLLTLKARFRERSEFLKQLNPLFRRNADGLKVPDALTQVSPAALISLSAVIGLFHAKGIRTIRLPLFFPLREHKPFPIGPYSQFSEDELHTIDLRLQSQKTALAQRIAFEIQGVSLTSHGEIDDYLILSLGEELNGRRPVTQSLLTVMP